MKAIYSTLILLALVLAVKPARAQARPPLVPTVVNIGLRAYDTVDTCRALASGTQYERWLPTQRCAGVVAINSAFAGGAWSLDYLLRKHGHPRLAQLQWISAAGSASGIVMSIRWKR